MYFQISKGTWHWLVNERTVVLALLLLVLHMLDPRLSLSEEPKRDRPEAKEELVLLEVEGIRFGIFGTKQAQPAPTLFIFATTIEATLSSEYYRQAGNDLLSAGFVLVSLDMPCHGEDHRPGEEQEIKGWRQRLAAGEDIQAGFARRVSRVIDHLVAEKWTDPEKIAACGTSRGGFSALHLAAREPRVKCVAAYAPPIRLSRLTEFAGPHASELSEQLSLFHQVAALHDRPIWLVVGDRDDRIGTEDVIKFARSLSEHAQVMKKPAGVELHVLPAEGHTVPKGSAERSAQWILQVINAE